MAQSRRFIPETITDKSSASDFTNKLDKIITRSAKIENKIAKRGKGWYGVVNIGLIEARDLPLKPDNSLPDPFVKFKLGSERCKSKTKQKTVNPKWGEQFDMYMFEDKTTFLEIFVQSDEIGSRELPLGECVIDLNMYFEQVTHHVDLPLNDNSSFINLLLTVSYVAETAPKPTYKRSIRTKREIQNDFSYLRTFHSIWRVGWLEVTVIRAQSLASADLVGSSDPYCVVQLDNNRLQTQTFYKTVNPEWNKKFTMNIKDIHSVLECIVYDEDKSRKVDFLGKVAIPLLKVQLRQRVWYQLKDEKLLTRKKGALELSIDYVYNPVRAAIRTFNPKEEIFMKPEPRLKVSTMKNNLERSKGVVKVFIDFAMLVQSCLNWESKSKSIIALCLYILCVLYMDLYMIPLFFMILLLKNLISSILNNFSDTSLDSASPADDDEDDFESKIVSITENSNDKQPMNKEEKKSILEKFQAIQEVCVSVQEILDVFASTFERIRNLFRWRAPWLTSLGLFVLFMVTLVLYLIPVRVLLLVLGIRKFSNKLINPNFEENYEVLHYLSRIPCDRELVCYKDLEIDSNVQVEIKKANSKLK